jgi:hypothetical protein
MCVGKYYIVAAADRVAHETVWLLYISKIRLLL